MMAVLKRSMMALFMSVLLMGSAPAAWDLQGWLASLDEVECSIGNLTEELHHQRCEVAANAPRPMPDRDQHRDLENGSRTLNGNRSIVVPPPEV